ncbi:MAG TPA: hypothetical protein VFK16_03735 [Gemmatimonadaceae bacterium]|nr:hypothetical protein [Gemmatimonadaceae bacterium]
MPLNRVAASALLLFAPSFAAAQASSGWDSPRVDSIVRTAVARRLTQLSDTGLIDYQATAHGYLTFLVQLGTGFPTPPKIVRTDQVALEVYWRSPNLGKQRIIGRRDTTLLPTDIRYHRDHLGIVQNNFPNIIRLGDGDEVRDAPHPLSPAGLELYDYRIADSLRISIPGQTFDVYEVKVRPKDATKPRVVGALYLDRTSGQVVRMALSFTRAALIDPQLEDISIVLENALVGGRFWLPRHQEIEIRRTSTWFDYPIRGIIRGRWEVSDYQLNQHLSTFTFAGPTYDQAPPAALRRYPWTGNILDSLPPDVEVTTDEDVRRVQAEARALVRGQALRRAQSMRLAAHGLSDFAQVNRVQGLALGAGVEQRLTGPLWVAGHAQYGIDDHEWRGGGALRWRNGRGADVSLFARRVLADAHDEPQRSGVINSMAAQEFGSDATEPFDVKAAGVTATIPAAGFRWTVALSREEQRGVAVHATPAEGRFASTIGAPRYDPWHLALRADRDVPVKWQGAEFTWSVSGDAYRNTYDSLDYCPPSALLQACAAPARTLGRIAAIADVRRPFGDGGLELRSHTVAAFVGATDQGGRYVPPQFLVYLGGPLTAPGYALHLAGGTRGVSERVEARVPVPFVPISLGTFGRSPARATLAPFVNLAGLDPGVWTELPGGVTRWDHFLPSVGVGVIGLFGIVRLDVARGLKAGGRWTFNIDFAREFWSIL